MTKGYVLVDIPESCIDCQLCVYDDIMGFCCHGSIDNGFDFVEILEEIINNELKPDWCPIKEFPEFEAKLGTYQEDW